MFSYLFVNESKISYDGTNHFMKNFKRIVLNNGLRVILVPQKSSMATTVLTLVEAGSKYETKELNGISHFLEHMCFKGTTKRPKAGDIAGELDGLGASYNAFTSQEFTSYYAKVKNEYADRVLEIVADLYLNPIFDPNEIEKEKGVIIEEINMYEDLPARKIYDIFSELVYGDQPVGWSVAGRKEVIQKITQNDFLNYRGQHYLGKATTFVIAGGFDEKDIHEKIEKYFTGMKNGEKGQKPKVVEEQKIPAEKIHFKESDQTHMILGFRAFSIFDERRFALSVLSDILGGGMSSRLFRRIREEMGAAYSVGAYVDLLSDHGVIAMGAGVTHAKLGDVIKAGLEEFVRFSEEPVTEADLRRAKDHMNGQLSLSLETSDLLGYFYGDQEAMGRPILTPEEVEARIEAVTASEIRSVARDLFKNEHLNLAAIGPFKDITYRDILKV